MHAHVTSTDGYQRVLIEVTDSGRWRPPPADPGTRGRGLTMIRGCTEILKITTTANGTQVAMTSRPVCPPRLTPAHHAAATQPA